MKFRNSEVPLTLTSRAWRTGDLARLYYFEHDSQARWWQRAEKLERRKQLLRAANRRLRRQLGLSFKNA